ncbi:MAG TPA: PKD domain-containing protein, partial [Myxococcaceae bacterium]|nr:PKD domain-containing protein [Myxococcaceae bacterium]
MALGRRLFLAALLALTACGSKAPGGGGGGGNPPPGGSGSPTAAFTAPASAQAGTVVPFDASASRAADGSALSYFWEFGGGRRGAGPSIAEVFDEVGSRQVSLTVVDAQGRSARLQKALDVTAGPAPAAMVNALGRVNDLDGHPIEGVTVAPGGGAASTSTDALGQAHIQVPAGAPVAIRLSKSGFADQLVRLELPASTGADADFEATLRPRDAAQTLADAAAGGTLQGRDGARIVFPAGALVDGSGAAVSGPVDVSLTPVDVT